ncbi:queuosine-tRNA galactosyltransferase-like [Tubulanus polymorphus]|uniref:queuosine-tRNA galactosyltransferase-like n=1 Tax=Tubulanus polymorphus TaxID=672921 RepID=UPI003DA25EA2
MVDVSVILPVHDAEKWLDECLHSVWIQQFPGTFELSIYNDASQDESLSIIQSWTEQFKLKKVNVVFGENKAVGFPKGVGFAKNAAIKQSHGRYLCFLDSDDVMLPGRIEQQYIAAKARPNSIIGCRFYRLPEDSTERFTKWANTISQHQLKTQIYTSHGPTIVMPTWFCSRDVYNNVGGFSESGKGTPEDLIFFFKHLELGGSLHRLDECLLMYRYHPDATTFSIKQETIWNLRVAKLQEQVLSQWDTFTIWNAGKQGRRLYRTLTPENRKKVKMFCDVDDKKIEKGIYRFEGSPEKSKPEIPIVHFTQLKPPVIICMKLDLTCGCFEENLESLNLTEGIDYFHFN